MRSPVISNTAVHLDIFLIDDPLKEWGLRVLADWLMVHSVTGLVWCEVSPVPGLCQYFSFFILSHLAPKLSSQNDTQRISRRTFDRSGERWGELGPSLPRPLPGQTVAPVRLWERGETVERERERDCSLYAGPARLHCNQRWRWWDLSISVGRLPSQWQPAELILHPSLLLRLPEKWTMPFWARQPRIGCLFSQSEILLWKNFKLKLVLTRWLHTRSHVLSLHPSEGVKCPELRDLPR